MVDHRRYWAAMAICAAPLAVLSRIRFVRMQLPRLPILEALPSLSIIVPVRNEARNLRLLLPSLCRIDYPGCVEIIVVDDNSSDRSAEIARQAGANVVALPEPPEGWLGKPRACQAGAAVATGEWLLFTDADTVHSPDGPARTVNHALRSGLDALSLFLRQESSGLVSRLALTTAMAGLLAGLQRSETMVNGQYVLVRKESYCSTGGHMAVANQLLEDLALGRHFRSHGLQVGVFQDASVAGVHMYSRALDLWHGMNRIGAGSLGQLGPRSLVAPFLVASSMTPVLNMGSALVSGRKRRQAAITWAIVAIAYTPWFQATGSVSSTVLAPLGALFVQFAAVNGMVRRLLRRKLLWRGRRV